MKLCRTAPVGQPVPVSADLAKVLGTAKDLADASGGAFDVTVGPVVKLWRIARRKKVLPDKAALAAALQAVGNDLLTVDRERQTVTLHHSNMQLDLGGIAKGYAADEALNVLKEHGLPTALVAVAGDIRAGNAPPGLIGWRVEVEDYSQEPRQERPKLLLFLHNQAVSTSGDTYQYLEIKKVRYSHLVDPQTGIGLTTPRSVTIIAPTGIEADALASAVSILGPVKGFKLLETIEDAAAFIAELQPDGKCRKYRSPGWDQIPRRVPTGD
jgi:thiamine biosynthesis lipoprotein